MHTTLLAVIAAPAWILAQTPSSQVHRRQLPTTVFSGDFITLDAIAPRAQALAVRDGRIVAIGTRLEVDAVVGRTVRHVQLNGVVLPGFADAHVHAADLGDYLATIDLRGASKAELLSRVREAALRAAPGAWIRGAGWDQSFWNPPQFPTASELDGAAGQHAVLLDRIDGHAVWVNTRAMTLAGMSSTTADVAGGRIVRDANGAPSGVFVDDAMALVTRAVPALPMAERVTRLRAALAQYARWGLTSIHDAGIRQPDIDAYHALLREGPLPVRVYAMASADERTLAAVFARGPELASGDGTFTLRCIKIVDDGALGSRGARLTDAYSDEAGQRGFDLVPDGLLDRIIARSLARGFQVAVHAIGDASTHDVLDAFERVGPVAHGVRFRIEHASMINDADLPRLARLDVIASMQPVFVGEYSRFAEQRVGAARLSTVMRTRDVIDSHAAFAAGTDFPASDTGDPILTLDALVTRRGYDGQPAGGWVAGQRVTVDVALHAMTTGPAWAAFEEADAGVLRVGAWADMTVLSGDPYRAAPGALRALRVQRTILGGRTTARH